MQATPANWPNNHENIGAKGWAFLLPTVTPEVHCYGLLRLPIVVCRTHVQFMSSLSPAAPESESESAQRTLERCCI